MAASALSQVLTRRKVQQLAGESSFERGEIYVAKDRVRSLVERGRVLTAVVSGTEDYSVQIEASDAGLCYTCSCPMGADGSFCKHCVATALSWLGTGQGSGTDNATPLVRLDDARSWLLEQDRTALAEWLLDAAARDERLREKLLRQAARAREKSIDFSAYRRSIDRATTTRGFVDYHEAGGFTQGVREAIEPLRDLLQEGHAAEAVGLTEHALERVEAVLGEVDHSDGDLGSILTELQEVHLEACRAARPDPEKLAVRLFDWYLNGDWDVFHNAAKTYADVLGEKGLAVYRARAEAEWNSLPNLKPGQRENYSSRRFHITSIMESLASASGDPEALIAVKTKDLSSAWHFLEIAQLYHEAKQHDAALDWAERGMKAFPAPSDPRLRVFLADEYHRRRRHDEAMALIWRQFEERPGFENFQLLKRHADRAEAWPQWRVRALAALRSTNGGAARLHAGLSRWYRPPDRSELVRIFLWEKDTEMAWTEAQQGGCSSELWLKLSAAREEKYPADAASVYLREAEVFIEQKNNHAYQEAVRLLIKARTILHNLGQVEKWETAIRGLRLTHKAKRNFIALTGKL